MAARVWLRCIHSRHDVEWLDGQWFWSGEHSLVQRNAAWYRRWRRSVASQDSGGARLAQKSRRSTTRDWVSLLQIPAFRLLLVIAALVEGSHALHDSFSVIRWRAAGAGLPVISALWSESVLSEVLVFLLIGPRLVRLLAPGGAITLAAVAGVIRWTVAAFTTSPVILAFVQPLHGFTFALLHLAAMQVIVRVVPLRLAATAQAIYGTLCIGLATAVLTLASGLLYDRMGGPAFLVMAALCMLALPLCARLRLPGIQV